MRKVQEWDEKLRTVDRKLCELEEAWTKAKDDISQRSGRIEHAGTATLSEAIAVLSQAIENLKARNVITGRFGIRTWGASLSLQTLIEATLDRPRSTETGTTQLRRAAALGFPVLRDFAEIQRASEDALEAGIQDARKDYCDLASILHDPEARTILNMAEANANLRDYVDCIQSQYSQETDDWLEREQAKESLAKAGASVDLLRVAMEFSTLVLMANVAAFGVKIARQTLLSEYWSGMGRFSVASLMGRAMKVFSGLEAAMNGDGVPQRKVKQRRITEFYGEDRVDEAVGVESDQAMDILKEDAQVEEVEGGDDNLKEEGYKTGDYGDENEAEVEEERTPGQEEHEQKGEAEDEEAEADNGSRQRLIASFFFPVSGDHEDFEEYSR